VIARALQFAFHSTEGKKRGACWEKNPTIAKRAGMTAKAVQNCLSELDENGHIIRAGEPFRGKSYRVIYPCFNREIEALPKRERSGGLPKGVSGRARAAEKRSEMCTEAQTPTCTEPQSIGGTEVQTPRILEDNPGENPIPVQGVRTGARTVVLDDDLDAYLPKALNRKPG
jgi:hypothetical protein